jgi:hypothetical protein
MARLSANLWQGRRAIAFRIAQVPSARTSPASSTTGGSRKGGASRWTRLWTRIGGVAFWRHVGDDVLATEEFAAVDYPQPGGLLCHDLDQLLASPSGVQDAQHLVVGRRSARRPAGEQAAHKRPRVGAASLR